MLCTYLNKFYQGSFKKATISKYVHKIFIKSHIKSNNLNNEKGAFLMRKGVSLLLACSFFLIITACTAKNTDTGQLDYEQTKKMIVDILKTDEGKKAFKDIMADEEMKQQLIMDQTVVADTIEQTLTSEKGTHFWKRAFEDTKFAEAMARSMKKENEKLLKALMKDPEYQGMMMDILKDPALQDDFSQALKSKDFREHLQAVITETLESPLYKIKIEELLLKAAEDMKKENGESKDEEDDGGEDGGEDGDKKEDNEGEGNTE